jgi:ferredoxin
MKAKVDHDSCIGCGLCTDTCPEVFKMGDDDIAVVYCEITASTEETAKEACDNCPSSSISLE